MIIDLAFIQDVIRQATNEGVDFAELKRRYHANPFLTFHSAYIRPLLLSPEPNWAKTLQSRYGDTRRATTKTKTGDRAYQHVTQAAIYAMLHPDQSNVCKRCGHNLVGYCSTKRRWQDRCHSCLHITKGTARWNVKSTKA